MPNLAKVLKEEIARVSRREGRALVARLHRQTTQHRRDIAALRRELGAMARKLAFLVNQERRRVGKPEVEAQDDAQNLRFQARGLRSHRKKLGLSATEYGRLIDVSGQSIYLWEQGKTRPRRRQLALLASIRGLGKREALQRLELLNAKRDPSRGEAAE